MNGRRGYLLDCRCPIEWSYPLNRGLIADWTVSPLSGWRGASNLRDLVRGGKNPNDASSFVGTGGSLPVWQGAGRRGSYGQLSFNGSAWINLAATVSPADFSAFFWVKQTGDNALLGNSGLANPQLRVGQSGNNVLSTYDGSNNPQSSTLLAAQGVWQQVGFTRLGNTVTFWQNGIAYGTGTFNVSGGSNFNEIGSFASGNNNFNGSLDSVQLWARALTPSEVAANYDQTSRGNPDRWRWLARTTWFVPPITTVSRNQDHYRWRLDDGSESAATWEQPEDGSDTFAVGVNRRLRVQTDTNGADPPSEALKLQYRQVGSGLPWRDVETGN